MDKKFVEDVVDGLEKYFDGCGYHITVQDIQKNNAVTLCGLCVRKEGEEAAPIIYLENYWDEYEQGMDMEQIISDIAGLCKLDQVTLPVSNVELQEFSKVKRQIVFRVINKEKNRSFLEDVPYREFADLAVVYYILIGNNECGQFTALIHNSQINIWKVTEEELYKVAYENTPKLLPMTLQTMGEVIREMCEKVCGNFTEEREESFDDEMPLYILTNRKKTYGAAVMLYPDAMKLAAERIGSNLVILPSSLHEVLLLPYDKDEDPEMLREMVRSVNVSEVPEEDILSDNVYFYEVQTDKIKVL